VEIPTPSSGWITAMLVAGGVNVALPLVAIVAARRRLAFRWRVVLFGAAVFAAAQLLLRLPIITFAGLELGERLASSVALQWAWLGALALSAGLFEEVGRWLGYRHLLRDEPRTLATAIGYGLGHGAVEAVLLVGLGQLLTAGGFVWMRAGGFAALPAEAQEAVRKQVAALAGQPDWLPLLSVWERVSSLTVHVALATVVLLAIVGRRIGWLVAAVIFHAVSNFVPVAWLTWRGSSPGAAVVAEVIISVFALAGLAFMVRASAQLEPEPDQQPHGETP
jgi:uncharacterized membrane protein YhfC